MSQNIKRIYLPKFYLFIIALVSGCFLLFAGCTSRVEGCLDIAASNFDFSADKACDGCCTYPSLSISLSQKWNERNFSTTDTLMDINGHPYKITDLKYYLSSWSWKDAGNMKYTVDSAMIKCSNGDLLHYTPDIVSVDSKQFQYTLGATRNSPTIDSVFLKLGLIPALDCVDPAGTNTPPVLADESPLYDAGTSSRAAIRLVLQRDTSLLIYDTLFIHTSQDLRLTYDLSFKTGLNTTLNLSVNYANWFSGVDIQVLGSFEQSILAGIPGSIFKTP